MKQRLDAALVGQCVDAWMAAYRHIDKWRERDGNRSSFDGACVDDILARHGIRLPRGRHSMSLYRRYEHAVVEAAYARMGVARPVPSQAARLRTPAEPDPHERAEEIVRLYLDGLSTREVADAIGVSPTTVRTELTRAGVERRPQGRTKGKSQRRRAA